MIKFAIQIENQFGYNWKQTKEIINKTEINNYHSFYICDHFFLDKDSVNRDTLEAWSVLTAAAVITKKIKLGTLVTGNNYRNPALLAKIAATLDVISDGRMEFGIGAGWKEIEYKAYGFDFPSVKDRMDMLEESIKIVKMLWGEERSTFNGKHYSLTDAVFSPKPDNPLFLIGGAGEKVTLKLVAKYADYMNLPFTPMDQIKQKLSVLKKHCDNLGRDYESVGKSIFSPIYVCEDDEEVDNYLQFRSKLMNISVDELKARIFSKDYPGSFIGLPEQIKERIDYLIDLGFDYFFIQQPFDLSSAQIEKFAKFVKDKYY
jgi:F420-dependent oxidoreductase-like protein